CELIYRWTDLRGKRAAFEQEHENRLKTLRVQMGSATEQEQLVTAELTDRRVEERHLSEVKGGIQMRLNQISDKAKEYSDFIEDLARAALTNFESALSSLEHQLVNAATESRDKAQVKVDLYRKLVAQKQNTIAHFDRALVTVLRRDFTDE